MMAMSEIICTPLETAKVVSRAPDLWTGIFQALLGLNWEGVGSFSNTKREYFDPGGLFDFPLLTFSEFSPGGISDAKREYFHPMGLFDFWPVEVFDVWPLASPGFCFWSSPVFPIVSVEVGLSIFGREVGAGAVGRSILSMKGQ
jgi:hypothetical protein